MKIETRIKDSVPANVSRWRAILSFESFSFIFRSFSILDIFWYNIAESSLAIDKTFNFRLSFYDSLFFHAKYSRQILVESWHALDEKCCLLDVCIVVIHFFVLMEILPRFDFESRANLTFLPVQRRWNASEGGWGDEKTFQLCFYSSKAPIVKTIKFSCCSLAPLPETSSNVHSNLFQHRNGRKFHNLNPRTS